MTDNSPYFDGTAFYNVIDAARTSRGMNWKDVAEEASVNASTLTRMSQGKRPDADSLAKLSRWAGINPADYVKNVARAVATDPLAIISSSLNDDPNLSEKNAKALDEIIKAAYQSLRKS